MSVIETIIDIPAEHEKNVCGQFDSYLKKIERTLHVTMIERDGALKIIGPEQMVQKAKSVFNNLIELSKRGNAITEQNVDYALSLSFSESDGQILEIDKDIICRTITGKPVKPKTMGQKQYVDQIRKKMIVFGIGPAGTGKTYLAMAMAIQAFKNGEVTLRRGPIYQCAVEGGFGVLDEINMAKNESLSVLHATLDFRRIIDVPGYDRITLSPCTRFIATMNYGYAGTRELNEALASRFMVINMPVISADSLEKLLKATFPKLRAEYARQLAELFQEIRKKCDSSEISTKALDLRGLIAAVHLTEQGLSLGEALEMGILNKSFDDFERQLVSDIVGARIPGELRRGDLFEP